MRSPAATRATPRPRSAQELWSGVLLAGFVLLTVARPLVPSEISASRGGGQLFVVTWLVLGALWLLTMAAGRRAAIVWLSRGDLLVLAFFGWQCGLGLWHASGGATRAALNLVGENLALAVGYLLARQLIRGAPAMRWMLAAMIALTVVQSALGLFQYAVTMPATRAAYRENPEQALFEAGVNAPPGSSQRVLFEQRLASSEPVARFELTNSLAGFLTIWLVALVAAAVVSHNRRDSAAALAVAVGAIALVIVACLVLTKSRSAYLATAAAAALLAAWQVRRRGLFNWRGAAWVAVPIVVIVAVAFATRGLDREVLTEAPKSLGYRLQYWQATAEMIRRAPLTGVGLANFGDHYTLYKVPEASEEVADPHNFLLEVAASSGLPAAALLVAALALFFWQARGSGAPATNALEASPRWIIAGATLAPLLATVASLLADVPLVAHDLIITYAAGAGALFLLVPWLRCEGPLAAPLALAAGALTLNLLAAGGIGFPSVAGSLWLVVAIGRSAALGDDDRRTVDLRAAAAGALCMSAAAIGVFLLSFQPVVASQAKLREAQSVPGSPDEQRARLSAAAAADDLASEPWAVLAGMELDTLSAGPAPPAALDPFRRAISQWLRRASPASSAAWLHAGDLYLAAYHLGRSEGDLRSALDAYARAVATYPNNPLRRARFALALHHAGDARAATEAAAAWRLDALTPHADQKLTPDVRAALTARGWPPN